MNAIAFALKKITLEPTIFGLAFGCAIEGGAQITTNLLIEKICYNELNYTKETCAKIYNWSLPFFPGAVMVVSACTLGFSALLNFYLYTQRHCLMITRSDLEDKNIDTMML